MFLTNPPDKNGHTHFEIIQKTPDLQIYEKEIKDQIDQNKGTSEDFSKKKTPQTNENNINNVFNIFEGFEDSPIPKAKKKEIIPNGEKEEGIALLNSEYPQTENRITDEEKLKMFILYFFAASINQRDDNLESKLNEDNFFDLFKSYFSS